MDTNLSPIPKVELLRSQGLFVKKRIDQHRAVCLRHRIVLPAPSLLCTGAPAASSGCTGPLGASQDQHLEARGVPKGTNLQRLEHTLPSGAAAMHRWHAPAPYLGRRVQAARLAIAGRFGRHALFVAGSYQPWLWVSPSAPRRVRSKCPSCSGAPGRSAVRDVSGDRTCSAASTCGRCCGGRRGPPRPWRGYHRWT